MLFTDRVRRVNMARTASGVVDLQVFRCLLLTRPIGGSLKALKLQPGIMISFWSLELVLAVRGCEWLSLDSFERSIVANGCPMKRGVEAHKVGNECWKFVVDRKWKVRHWTGKSFCIALRAVEFWIGIFLNHLDWRRAQNLWHRFLVRLTPSSRPRKASPLPISIRTAAFCLDLGANAHLHHARSTRSNSSFPTSYIRATHDYEIKMITVVGWCTSLKIGAPF